MGLRFSWDGNKDRQNQRKHRVSFQEASSVFGDVHAILIYDPDHSENEDRWLLLGQSDRGRLLMVVFVDRGGIIRVISARRAAKRESHDYEASRKE